jgi:hypothetical protein
LWVDRRVRDLAADHPVAIRLDVAQRLFRLLDDDRWRLRNARRVPADGIARSDEISEPELAYGVVERRAQRDHGRAVLWHQDDGARHFGHSFGDVPALFIVAAALAFFTPRADKARARTHDALAQIAEVLSGAAVSENGCLIFSFAFCTKRCHC